MDIHVCEWVHMRIHTCEWVLMHMYVEAGGQLQESFLEYFPPCSLDLGLPSWLNWLASEPRDPPLSASPALGLRVCAAMTSFSHVLWKLNSEPRSLMAITF